MALTMRERRAVTWELAKPYHKALKKEKDLSASMQRLRDAESKLKQLQPTLTASGKALNKAKAKTEAVL